MVFHFPPMSGGGVIVVSELANSLASLGHKVTVLAPDVKWDGQRYEPELDSNIKVCRVPVPSRDKIKIAARRCKSSMEKEAIVVGNNTRFDFILTVFHPFHLVPAAATNAGKKLGIPVITKVDDAVYAKTHGLKTIQRKIENIYLSKTLNNSSKILVPNSETGTIVSKIYNVDEEKISIVPNGVNLSEFYSLQEPKNQVVFSGVMYHHRGIDVLLDAAPQVLNKMETKFLLIGEGPEMEKLQQLTKEKKLSRSIKFAGWVEKNQIPKYLSESKIGIGPLRRTEVTENALPIKVLEYMAACLPIIATKGTLPKNVLMDGINGYFVSNSSELAEKIIMLLKDDSLRKTMGKKSREIVQDFDWKQVAGMIIKNYERCL